MKQMSTRGTPAEEKTLDLDRFLPYLLNVIASRVSRGLATVYETRFGISIAEWRVIAHLAQNQKVSVREIHARVDLDRVKVSRAAERLNALGLVAKRVHPGDRRLLELNLTRKGRKLFNEVSPLALAYEDELLRTIGEKDAAALRRIVANLTAHPAAKRRRRISPA